MSRILISGLVNLETTCNIGSFPVGYQPIEYNFFGQSVNAAGVGYNLTAALRALGDEAGLASLTGKDPAAGIIRESLKPLGAETRLQDILTATPVSTVLYDRDGRRRIYCDLKDIQDKSYDFSDTDLRRYDMVAACNINFSRPLLRRAKDAGVKIATDVHVLGDAKDGYNAEFMEFADVLFLSNEAVRGREEEMLGHLKDIYRNDVIVTGCGADGAIMYVREKDAVVRQAACKPERIVNTVGAGDALFSAFISFYAKGYEPETCLRLAQTFAAHKIGFDGASAGFMTAERLLAAARA